MLNRIPFPVDPGSGSGAWTPKLEERNDERVLN